MVDVTVIFIISSTRRISFAPTSAAEVVLITWTSSSGTSGEMSHSPFPPSLCLTDRNDLTEANNSSWSDLTRPYEIPATDVPADEPASEIMAEAKNMLSGLSAILLDLLVTFLAGFVSSSISYLLLILSSRDTETNLEA